MSSPSGAVSTLIGLFRFAGPALIFEVPACFTSNHLGLERQHDAELAQQASNAIDGRRAGLDKTLASAMNEQTRLPGSGLVLVLAMLALSPLFLVLLWSLAVRMYKGLTPARVATRLPDEPAP